MNFATSEFFRGIFDRFFLESIKVPIEDTRRRQDTRTISLGAPSIRYTSTIKPPLRGLVRSIRKYTRSPHKISPRVQTPICFVCTSLLLCALPFFYESTYGDVHMPKDKTSLSKRKEPRVREKGNKAKERKRKEKKKRRRTAYEIGLKLKKKIVRANSRHTRFVDKTYRPF